MLMKMERNVRFVHGIGKILFFKVLFENFCCCLDFVLVVHLNRITKNLIIQVEISLLNGKHQLIIFVIYQIVNK
jgi:hypothetical protein